MQTNQSEVQKDRSRLYHSVFGTPDGRRVLMDLMSFSGFMSDPFDANPHVTSYRTGVRTVVSHILRHLSMNNVDDLIGLTPKEESK